MSKNSLVADINRDLIETVKYRAMVDVMENGFEKRFKFKPSERKNLKTCEVRTLRELNKMLRTLSIARVKFKKWVKNLMILSKI
jgi:hypothetical protein